MNAAEVISRCRGPMIKTARGAKVICPCHGGESPTCSIEDGDVGVVITCYERGCSAEDVALSLDLKVSDLFFESRDSGRGSFPDGCTLTALAAKTAISTEQLTSFGLRDDHWSPGSGGGVNAVSLDYRNDDGSHFRTKYRVSAAGKDKYRWGTDGRGQIPYGLWRLPVMEDRKGLAIVEGETDSMALWCEGLTALGLPGASSSKTLQAAHVEGFSSVTIVGDDDDAGRTFLESVGARLTDLGYTGDVRAFVPPGYNDIVEWRAGTDGSFLDELKRRWQAATPPGNRPVYDVLAYDPALRESYHWNPYIPSGSLTIMVGMPGDGKSTIALAIAAAASRGGDEISGYAVRGGSTLIIANEDSANMIAGRFQVTGGGVSGKLAKMTEDDGFVLHEDGIERLRTAIKTHDANLIIIDPLMSYLPTGNKSNQDEVTKMLKRVDDMAGELDVSILAVMHFNKGDSTNVQDRTMGSRGFTSVARSVLGILRDPESTAPLEQVFLICHDKHNGSAPGPTLRYALLKNEDDPNVAKLEWRGRSRYTSADALAAEQGVNRHDLDEIERLVCSALVSVGYKMNGYLLTDFGWVARGAGIKAAVVRVAMTGLGGVTAIENRSVRVVFSHDDWRNIVARATADEVIPT